MKTKIYKNALYAMLITLIVVACGGGGGGGDIAGGGDTSKNVFEEQNEYAQQTISYTYTFAKAMNEETELLTDALGEGWEYWEWTEDDIRSVLGEDEIEHLADQVMTLYEQKIIPAADAAELSVEGLMSSEQKIQSLLNMVKSPQREFRFLGVGETVAVMTIAAIIAAAAAYLKKKRELLKGKTGGQRLVASLNGAGKLVGVTFEAGALSVGESVVLGGIAKTAQISKYGKLSAQIKGYSNVKTAAGTIIGVKECISNSEEQNKTPERVLKALYDDIDDLDIVYFGKSDDDGVFYNIPEGDWTFVVFEEGNVRSETECISIIEGMNEIEVSMNTIDEMMEKLDIENDTDNVCTDSSSTYVWYVENLPLKDVFVGTCEEFTAETPLCYYQGGGLDCSILADKVEHGSGYGSNEEAIDATCGTVSDIGPCGSTWSCGWLGWIGGERHVIDSLGGCQQ